MTNHIALKLLTCFCLSCQLLPAFATDDQQGNFQTYVNSEKKYSIEYPSDWQDMSNPLMPAIDLFVIAPSAQASMNIFSGNFGDSHSIADAISHFAASDPNIRTGQTVINGMSCTWICHKQQLGSGTETQVLQCFIYAQDKQYLLTFGAYPSDFEALYPQFIKIASSFRLVD